MDSQRPPDEEVGDVGLLQLPHVVHSPCRHPLYDVSTNNDEMDKEWFIIIIEWLNKVKDEDILWLNLHYKSDIKFSDTKTHGKGKRLASINIGSKPLPLPVCHLFMMPGQHFQGFTNTPKYLCWFIVYIPVSKKELMRSGNLSLVYVFAWILSSGWEELSRITPNTTSRSLFNLSI